MKTIGISLIALLMASPALAQDNTDMNNQANPAAVGDMTSYYRLNDLIGNPVYTVYGDADYTFGDDTFYPYDTDWEEIGEIDNVVIDQNGDMAGLIVEVGGFLDIGDRHVLVSTDNLELAGGDSDDIIFVTNYTEEQLEALPAVDDDWF